MVLGETLKVGDTVVINIPQENWDWGYRPVPDQKGTKAVVTGFGEIPYSRVQSYGREPGVYVNHAWVNVKVPGTKEPIHISSCHIDLADKDEEKERLNAYRKAGGYDSSHVRLRDLPEMKLWEHDVVRWIGGGDPWPGVSEFKVVGIHYESLGQMRNDGVTPMPEYDISPNEKGRGGYMAVNETDLELIRRGNVWKHYHGEKSVFSGIEEEAEFAELIGQVEEVRNPANQLYSWTLGEVLAAIREGTVDGIAVSSGMFGTRPMTRAKRFKDRDLGRRVAAATLEGFKDHNGGEGNDRQTSTGAGHVGDHGDRRQD